jgi:hypothetical protein
MKKRLSTVLTNIDGYCNGFSDSCMVISTFSVRKAFRNTVIKKQNKVKEPKREK